MNFPFRTIERKDEIFRSRCRGNFLLRATLSIRHCSGRLDNRTKELRYHRQLETQDQEKLKIIICVRYYYNFFEAHYAYVQRMQRRKKSTSGKMISRTGYGRAYLYHESGKESIELKNGGLVGLA